MFQTGNPKLDNRLYQNSILFAALLCAFMMAIFPMTVALSWARPDWVVLVVIYWALNRPKHLGVGAAWLIGLLQDVFIGGVWGAHALALSVVAYLCAKSYRQLRSYAVSQQTFWVFVLVGMHHVLVSWLEGFSGYGVPAHLMLASVFTSAVCWPILAVVLRKLNIMASPY